MPLDKNLVTRSTGMLLLKLLQDGEMYGYQMIEELARRSDRTFQLKAGTLYPLLHDLQQQGLLDAFEQVADTGRVRKYYRLTNAGRNALVQKEAEWASFSTAVNKVMEGSAIHAAV